MTQQKREFYNSSLENTTKRRVKANRKVGQVDLFDSDNENYNGDELHREKLSQKEAKIILSKAKSQQEEIAREEKNERIRSLLVPTNIPSKISVKNPPPSASSAEESDHSGTEESSDNESIHDIEYKETVEGHHEDISEQDRALFEKWTSPTFAVKGVSMSLSDMILDKLKHLEHPSEENATEDKQPDKTIQTPSFNPKVVEVYTKLGLLLARYKSGKLPKAFKVIPVLKNWQDILALTAPDQWTPHAVYQATRLFSSTLKDYLAQRFYEAILLPHFRKDVRENKKLNYHLYLALKKAIYKPVAFFKGLVIPLCEMTDVTLKEAAILGSILSKTGVPVLHASACLMKVCPLNLEAHLPTLVDSSRLGVISIIIRTILDKKYTLPVRVVIHLVSYFTQFASTSLSSLNLFVLWHQSLLVFVQRYKMELSVEQRDALQRLTQIRPHPAISPEVQRELNAAVPMQQIIIETH